MYKLGYLKDDQWVEYSHAAVFELPNSQHKTSLMVGVPGGDPTIFRRLTLCLKPHYLLLYVLHTPRGEGKPGRYQSPPIEIAEFEKFLTEFSTFLSNDSRSDIWAYSPDEDATIVWDRHNVVFAYGPISRYVSELRALGFNEGRPEIPAPHEHYYRSQYDSDSRALLRKFEWSYSPLRKQDEQ
jgi:hypothetical protein